MSRKRRFYFFFGKKYFHSPPTINNDQSLSTFWVTVDFNTCVTVTVSCLSCQDSSVMSELQEVRQRSQKTYQQVIANKCTRN